MIQSHIIATPILLTDLSFFCDFVPLQHEDFQNSE